MTILGKKEIDANNITNDERVIEPLSRMYGIDFKEVIKSKSSWKS
jgi:hypothetical protein